MFAFCGFFLLSFLLRRASHKTSSEITIKVDKKYCGRTYWKKKKNQTNKDLQLFELEYLKNMEKHYCQL